MGSVSRFALAVVVALQLAPLGAQTPVVLEGDTWDFLRGRTPPPTDWAEPGFDPVEAGWEAGPTGIGYGDDDDATVIDDMVGAYLTVYMRVQFVVPAALADHLWLLRVRYDDGFVAYVDGAEVARRNVEGYPPAYDTAASDHEILAPNGFDESILLDATFAPGSHVLAVEVHNVSLESSDLSFSAELSASPFFVTSVQPALGPVEGGNTVTISGDGFRASSPPSVQFGSTPSPSVEVVDARTLRVQVPAAGGPAIVDVVVQDARGTVVLPGAYRYSEASATGLEFAGGQRATARPFRAAFPEGTFEIWFRRVPQGGFDTWMTLLAVEDAAGGEALRIESRQGRTRARTWVGGNQLTLNVNWDLSQGGWHHLAFAYGPGERQLFLDGRLGASDTNPTELTSGVRLRIGAPFGNGSGLRGAVRSVRLWSHRRNELEIRCEQFAMLKSADGLEAAWYLEEGGGAVASDSGPGGIDLFLGETDQPEVEDPTWAAFDDFPVVAITGIDPSSGGIEGGAAVGIWGTGFSASRPPRVFFGAREATSVTVLEPWQLEVISPPGDAFGSVTVSVQSALGDVDLPDAWTYMPTGLGSFVKEGDLWSYSIGFEAPPPSWADPSFDPEAAGWLQGPSGLGYGDADDATDLPQMENGALTLYARTSWELTEPKESIRYLVLRIRYDDGFVAYLNGTEIARRNVAGNPPAFDEPASDLHEIGGGTGTFDEEIDILSDRDLLNEGINVLAVEVHNATLDSSDLSMSAEILYSAQGQGRTFLRGDIDGDGSHSITDAIKILRYLYLGEEISCLEAADVNDDGSLNVSDPVFLIYFLFLGGREPPPPITEPLPDLDGDDLDCVGA